MNGLIYDLLLSPLEFFLLNKERHKLVSRAQGGILELGIGTGLNLNHYSAQARRISGVDPDRSMLARAERRLQRTTKKLSSKAKLLESAAEALPFSAQSFDSVVATLVLCSVQDLESSIREIWRVLKPGGRLFLLEHVRHSRPSIGRALDLITPAWSHVAGGCRLNRDPEPLLMRAGFHVIERRVLWSGFGRSAVYEKTVPLN